MMMPRLLLAALLVVATATSHGQDLPLGPPCDESFPLAPPDALDLLDAADPSTIDEYRVAVPGDIERRSHAPLCTTAASTNDGQGQATMRIDLRRLRQCPGGSCFVAAYQDCFHMTSAECINPPPVRTPRPTPQPTYRIIETVHPVKLTLRNVPRGYRISAEVRSSILRWMSEMLREKLLGTGLTLVRVEYAGRLASSANTGGNNNGGGNNQVVGIKGPRPDSDKNKNGRRLQSGLKSSLRGIGNGTYQGQRRLDAVNVALRVTVRGPDDESEFALSYIMENIRGEFDDLVAYLKKNTGSVTIDGIGGNVVGDAGSGGGGGGNVITINPFQTVELGADTFSFENIDNDPTDPPTRRPTSQPTDAPVEEAVIKVMDNGGLNVVLEDTTVTIPWWVWLVVVLAIILLCICCVCGCLWRRKRNAKRSQTKQEQAISIWMGADDVEKKNPRGSMAGSRRSRRTSHRPPRSVAVGDASRRTSRRSQQSRPRRKKSMIEEEEEAREREFREQLQIEAARGPIDIESVATEESHPMICNGDLDVSDSARSVDPPEELALVPYSSKLTEPDGSRASKTASLYAADVYYGGRSNLDGSNRSSSNRASDPEASHDVSEMSMDPGGSKPPRVASQYAAEVYYAAPVTSSSKKPRRPRNSKAAKEDLYICAIDELPEEASTAVRSMSSRVLTIPADPTSAHEGSERRRKSKKKKKRSSEKKERSDGDQKRSEERRRRRSVTERLRSSLKMSKPQDVLMDESVVESILPMPPTGPKEEGHSEETGGDARYNESCATMSVDEHERNNQSLGSADIGL